MTFRAKLLLMFTVTAVVVVALVTALVWVSLRRSFERVERQRTEALVGQFRSEFARRAAEVARQVEAIAAADPLQSMAVALGRPGADPAPYVGEAATLAAANRLDLLELVAADGSIISSAHWPARFGYKEEWLASRTDWNNRAAFLRREELADDVALGLIAVREARAGDARLFIAGGQRLDRDFLQSLVLPAGMRVMLYRNTGPEFTPASLMATSNVAQPEKLAPLIQRLQRQAGEMTELFAWSADPADSETLHFLPLTGLDNELLGVFIVGSSRGEVVALERHVLRVALLVGLGGVLLGVLLSGWAARRVSEPVDDLADAARQVARGNWDVRVYTTVEDELGELASAFNRMIRELNDQRERLVQAERVAAWRELARRLAHELKNPLFPLQITVENLLRARERDPQQFDEVFRESTRTLLAEIANLKAIVQRFSDFAKMPAPDLRPLDLNQLAGEVLKLYEAQFRAAGRPPITARAELDSALPEVPADADLLRRALENLVLNAVDAMPSGGTLTVRTRAREDSAVLEVSDTGGGLTPEERARLFTPYYTTKQHGTGLGLAMVQAVVSDHRGKISVESEPGRGATFRVTLPLRLPETEARGTHA